MRQEKLADVLSVEKVCLNAQTIIHALDADYDESKYTHFTYLPKMRWIEKNGKIKEFNS